MLKSLPRRRIVLLAGSLLSVLGLAACGSTPANTAASGPTTVTLWESQSNQPVASAMNNIVADFNKANPGQKVQLHIISQGTQIPAAVTAGNPPIMGEVNHYIAQLRTAGALKSFTPYINGKNGFTQQELSQFYPSTWDDGNVNGQRYRILVDPKFSELLYNKALFQQAGITTPPTTYDQLAQDLALVQQKDPGVTPMGIDQSIGDFLPPFIANGGTLYAPGSTTQTAFNTPAGQTTLNWFHNAYQAKQLVFTDTNNGRSLFANNKLAVLDQTSAGSAPTTAAVGGKFPVGAFAWPNGTSGHGGNIIQGEGIVMLNSPNYTQAQYDTVWNFIKFWMQPKQQAQWAVQSGYPPMTKAAEQYITPQDYAANPGLKVSIDELNSQYTLHRPGPDNYAQAEKQIETALFNGTTGKQPVDATLASLDQQAASLLSGKTAQ